MSISQSHSDAARRNGALSNGATTGSGRVSSSRNAVKHDIFGSTFLLAGEDRDAFMTLNREYLTEHQPQTPTETHYVREMIDAEWRLTRTRAQAACIQINRMQRISETPSIKVSAEAFRLLSDESNSLSLLLRYENQFRRQFDKSLSQLIELQLARGITQQIEKEQPAEEAPMTMEEFLDAPTPGELLSPEEMHALIERLSIEARAKLATAKPANPNPINLQNEPMTREAAERATTNPVNRTQEEAQTTRQAA